MKVAMWFCAACTAMAGIFASSATAESERFGGEIIVLADATSPNKTTAKIVKLADLKGAIDGPAVLSLSAEEWKILSQHAVPTKDEFKKGEQFLSYIPNDGNIWVQDPCFGEEGMMCMPKMTPFGFQCKCRPLPGTTGTPTIPIPPSCSLATTHPLSDGPSPLACATLPACKGCCRLVLFEAGIGGKGHPGKLGCRCR